MPENRGDSIYERILSKSVLAGGIFFCLVAIYFGIHFYSVVPFADTWNIIDEIVKNNNHPSFSLMWAQHNEHRMAMTKLLMWADLYWARGKAYSLFFEIYLTQLFGAFLLTYAVVRIGKWRWVYAQTALGVALFCRFYLLQFDLFTWSFCIQVAPTYALAALAYIAVTRYAMTARRTWLAAAVAAGFLAPLNLAGGLVVWPVLCLAAWNLRVHARIIILLAGCGTVSTGIYLFGYVNPPGPKPWDALSRPADLLQYNLLYFAGSWDALSRPVGYVLAAAAMLGVIAWTVKVAIRRDASPLRVALLALAGSLMANAFMTSLGRLSFGIEQATESRYQTAALLFWCCIFLLLMDLLLQLAPKFVPAITATALALMLVAAAHTPRPWQRGKAFHESMEAGGLPLLADVKDDAIVSAYLLGTPWWVFEDTGFMRIHGMSLYDTPEFRRLDARLEDIYHVSASSRCLGYFDRFEAIPDPRWPGYRAYGWGWDRSLKRVLGKLVIANEAGRIVGLARGGDFRADVAPLVPEVTGSFSGWHGYVNGSLAWQRAQAYGELPGGREVCLLPNAPPRP